MHRIQKQHVAVNVTGPGHLVERNAAKKDSTRAAVRAAAEAGTNAGNEKSNTAKFAAEARTTARHAGANRGNAVADTKGELARGDKSKCRN